MGRPAVNGIAMSSSERSRRRRAATKLDSAADATKLIARVFPGCAPCNETPHATKLDDSSAAVFVTRCAVTDATKPVPLADAAKLVGDPVTVSAPEIMPEFVRRLSAASQREWRDGVGLFSPLAGRVPR
jgi:hypothetical protein